MERLESCEGRLGVEGVVGVAGGWVRWASDGNSGDDMAPSFRPGLLEAETLPVDCQVSSGTRDSDDAADVCAWSLGGALVDEGRLLTCCDDRLDPEGTPSTKLTDDFLRLGSSPFLSTSSWYLSYLSSSTSPITLSSSFESSASSSVSFPPLPLVIRYTPKNVNAQPPKNLPNRLASAA